MKILRPLAFRPSQVWLLDGLTNYGSHLEAGALVNFREKKFFGLLRLKRDLFN